MLQGTKNLMTALGMTIIFLTSGGRGPGQLFWACKSNITPLSCARFVFGGRLLAQ